MKRDLRSGDITTFRGSEEVADQRRERREAFIDLYGLRAFDYRPRNMLSLLTQGGASRDRVQEWLIEHEVARPYERGHLSFFLNGYGVSNMFDHFEMWGAQKTPLFLVGHPYDLNEKAFRAINGLLDLGMNVDLRSGGWYGFGTFMLRVSHRPTVERFRRPIPDGEKPSWVDP